MDKQKDLLDAQQQLAAPMADVATGRISPAEANRATQAIFEEARAAAGPEEKKKTKRSSAAGQIIRRGDNKWLVRVFLGRDGDGKRRYQNEAVKGTKKDAQAKLTATLRKQDLGQPTFEAKVTLQKYLDQWLKDVAKPRVSEQTHRGYEWQLAHVKTALGVVRLSRLRAEDIQKLYSTLPSSTARHVHAPLRSALKQAVKWQLIHANPCDAVELPRHRARQRQELTKEEVIRLLAVEQFTRKKEGRAAVVVENRYRVLFAFLLEVGARPSEALGLKWTDIDMETSPATVTIQRALQWHKGKGKGHYFSETKTKHSLRSVTLSGNLVRQLKEHRARQGAALLGLGVRTDLVFATTEGTPILRRNLVRRHFKPVLSAAKLPADFGLYGLRHTSASLLYLSGVHPKVISERLGHSSTAFTMDTYGNLMDGMQEAATAQLETLLYG
jgi:integrase